MRDRELLNPLAIARFGPFADFYFTSSGITVVDLASPYVLFGSILCLIFCSLILTFLSINGARQTTSWSVFALAVLLASLLTTYGLAHMKRKRMEAQPADSVLEDTRHTKPIGWEEIHNVRTRPMGMLSISLDGKVYFMKVRTPEIPLVRELATSKSQASFVKMDTRAERHVKVDLWYIPIRSRR